MAEEAIGGSGGGSMQHTNRSALDYDFADLDDKEFDIPTVTNEPTLEEILNTPDDVLPPLDYSTHVTGARLQPILDDERESISSQESSLSDRAGSTTSQHYVVMRQIIMKKISNQISSAADCLGTGKPTALAVSSQIAVGFAHGVVLVFGAGQALKWCLGSVAVGEKFGSVCALSFNDDCSRLLSAFSKGQVMMWDLTNGHLLRSISDAHLPDTGVVHVRFTDDRALALSSDARGSLFELKFRHLIGVRTCESRCLFSANKGEVCTIEPLRLKNSMPELVDSRLQIVAVASIYTARIITIRPQIKVYYSHQFYGDQNLLPVLAWQVTYMRDAGHVVPTLALAKGQSIKIVQLSCEEANDVKVNDFKEIQLSFKILCISWVQPNTMVAIDTQNFARVLDVHSGEELESTDLASVELIRDVNTYDNSHTVGDPQYSVPFSVTSSYQSVVACEGKMFMLGSKGIHVVSLRSWSERIDVLLRHACHEAALDLAVSFYDGTAKAVIGLTGNRQKQKEAVAERVISILEDFVHLAMTRLCPSHGKLEELQMHYQDVVSVCVDRCLQIGRLDFLFGKVYGTFAADVIAKGVFLECLEPYMLKDELKQMTPQLMKEFLVHYEDKGQLSAVDACIVHLDITNLDTEEIIGHCWEHELYDSLIYLYNKGLNDYVTPLDRLLGHLQDVLTTSHQLTAKHVQLGNKTLVYISCCLCGRSYPLDDLHPDLVAPVRNGVVECLLVEGVSGGGEGGQRDFPHLRTLIAFDAREFFNVLELAFQVEDLESEKKQQIVDRVLFLVIGDSKSTLTQFGVLFTFLARQMAKNERPITVDENLFDQVLESLCIAKEDLRHEERQQALLELLNTDRLKNFRRARLIELAESARFYRVCETLHLLNRDFDLILSCYCNDAARQRDTFGYVRSSLSGSQLTNEEKARVRYAAFGNLHCLVMINSHETAKLVLNGYIGSLRSATKQLFSRENEFYMFLSDAFQILQDSPDGNDLVRELDLETEVIEKYIELMCRKAPEMVLEFVTSNDGYRTEETLDICRRYKMTDALIYLLEKSADIPGAYELLKQRLQVNFDKIEAGHGSMVEAREANGIMVQFLQRNSLKVVPSQRESLWFCFLKAIMETQESLRRRSRKVGQTQKDRNDKDRGFSMPNGINDVGFVCYDLPNLSTASEELVENAALSEWLPALNQMMNQAIDAMMTYIPIQTILQKVLNDPAYVSGTFGEMKDLLFGMLDSCTYEKSLIQTCSILTERNIHDQLQAFVATATRGMSSARGLCGLCSDHVSAVNEKETVVCFKCSHAYHYSCLAEASSTAEPRPGRERIWRCVLCAKVAYPGQVRPRISSESTESTAGGSVVGQVQVVAWKSVRQSMRSSSKLPMLLNLKSHINGRYHRSIQSERLALRVAAPPPPP